MTLETIEKIVGLGAALATAGWWLILRAYKWRNRGTGESAEFQKLQKDVFALREEINKVNLLIASAAEDRGEIFRRLEKIEDKYTELIKDMFKYFQIK
jgi:hypothetical protein